MIDIGRAFKAPFEDTDWVSKTLLGFLWGLLGVTAPAVYGAQLDYISGVASGDERLPDWSDFGRKWVEGFMVFLAGLLYFLPVVVLGFVFVVPPIIALVSANDDSGALGAVLGGGLCIFWVIALMYSIVISVFFAAAMTNYAMRRNFGSFFDFAGIMALVRGGTGYFTAWLYTILIAFVGSAIVSVLSATGIGAVLAPAVAYLVAMISGHVLGQWARQAFGVQTIVASTAGPSGYPQASPPVPPAPPVAPGPPAPPA